MIAILIGAVAKTNRNCVSSSSWFGKLKGRETKKMKNEILIIVILFMAFENGDMTLDSLQMTVYFCRT